MELSDFELDRATFELRFEKAFAMWDRAGALTSSLTSQYPKADLQDANPGKISLSIRPNTEVVMELDKAFIIQHAPKRTGEDLIPFATLLTKSVTSVLEVNAFTRIGTRIIYSKEYSKIEAATEALLSIGRLIIPRAKLFGIQCEPETAATVMKWNGPATGVRVSVLSQTQKVEFIPAPAHSKEVQAIDKEKHQVLLDVDYYSTVTVMPDQFRADEWIKNVMHLINRDIHVFLKTN